LGLLFVCPSLVWAQTFSPQGGEYPLGALPGDQVFPNVSVQPGGGYIVWEDSAIDGNGRGIGALRLDNNFSPLYGAFRVNQRIAGDQEKPQVAAFANGGAAIVWEGGGQRFANVYARHVHHHERHSGQCHY